MSKPPRSLELDGRTGEGGGQLVRIAVALAAVACRPVRITHVRGNRPGKGEGGGGGGWGRNKGRGGGRGGGSSSRGGDSGGGGLKSQHVTAIEWLAAATDAEVDGLIVGSHTLEFRPRRRPAELDLGLDLDLGAGSDGNEGKKKRRKIGIVAASPAASAMLIFQAVLPFLLFACDRGDQAGAKKEGGEDAEDAEDPIELEIAGGTNVSFSPSYEYVDQVLLPALERWFGVRVARRLAARGWSAGPAGARGRVCFAVYPLRRGQALRFRGLDHPPPGHGGGGGGATTPTTEAAAAAGAIGEKRAVRTIDATILAPGDMHAPLARALTRDLDVLFPTAAVRFVGTEESGHETRMYVLLVARTDEPGAGQQHGPSATTTSGSGSGSGSSKKGEDTIAFDHQGHLRWGRDLLYAQKRRGKTAAALSDDISRRVSRELYEEVTNAAAAAATGGRGRGRGGGGVVDEFLQDQLVIFQALADGRTSFPRRGLGPGSGDDSSDGDRDGDDDDKTGALKEMMDNLALGEGALRRDRVLEPFGEGSMHTKTARWVAAELLPHVKWYNRGAVCEGVGMRAGCEEDG